MTARRHQFQRGTALALHGTLKGREEDRFHAAYPIPRAVGPNGGKSHLALESDQFAHDRHPAARQGAKGTMKLCPSQGMAA